MSAFSVVINIFAVIGLLVILIYIIYYLWSSLQQKNFKMIESRINPPSEYMQQSGIKCPDYWVNTGVDSNGNYICKNSYNVNVSKSTNSSCSNINCNADEAIFLQLPSGQTWQAGNPNGLTSMSSDDKYNFVNDNGGNTNASRCDWAKCCGASNNPSTKSMNQAVWLGVNEICNRPPSSM